ncbi:MAG: hypothetical protein ACQES9_10135 [Myxococcota bacterium]
MGWELTNNDPAPNIYKSGLWCSGGGYNSETSQYEATVLVTINSIDTIPLKNKKTYLQLPEEVNCVPEICTTDEKGTVFVFIIRKPTNSQQYLRLDRNKQYCRFHYSGHRKIKSIQIIRYLSK